jgi:hypothetical protein
MNLSVLYDLIVVAVNSVPLAVEIGPERKYGSRPRDPGDCRVAAVAHPWFTAC